MSNPSIQRVRTDSEDRHSDAGDLVFRLPAQRLVQLRRSQQDVTQAVADDFRAERLSTHGSVVLWTIQHVADASNDGWLP